MRNQRMPAWDSGYYPTEFHGAGRRRRRARRRRQRAAVLSVSFALFATLAIIWGLGTFISASGRTNHESDSATKGDVEIMLPVETEQTAVSAASEPVQADVFSTVNNIPDAYTSMAVNAEEDNPSIEASKPETVQDDSWMLMLVNRWNPLPEGYTVQLVDVPGGVQVDERIYQPLMEMLDAATEAGVGPIVVSGYRTQEKQQSLYDEKINEFLGEGYPREEAIAQAQQWVSVPGTSEHQTGLAVDINGMIWDVYPWLAENSYKYGFILRYPEDKTEITGTQHERWHFRYVGLEAAAEMYNRGLCLEEYLNEIDP